MTFRIFNTISNRVEEFVPHSSDEVTLYTCGPTVYRNAHIGNLRSYLMADWIRRALTHHGYKVRHVKNITDVGHMRLEMLEQGEDKVVAAAIAEGKTPKEISQEYTDLFFQDERSLNILPAEKFPRATDHIPEMITLTKRLMEQSHAYEVQGNVYFSVSSFPQYGQLSGNPATKLQDGSRVKVDPLKQDPRDFTLWKSAEPGRLLKWDSPWGAGFPGWHIECSAMSMKYLGLSIDIHTGGVDNIFPHHEGEIAQSQGATGLQFVRYWIHGQHLLADGIKMAKSSANDYTLSDLEQRGFDPLAFRYLCLTTQFNARLNFTFSGLRAAQRGLTRLRNRIWDWSVNSTQTPLSSQLEEEVTRREKQFWSRVDDNLDMPGALAELWSVAHSDLPSQTKLHLLRVFDDSLGLGLSEVPQQYLLPKTIELSLKRRGELRRNASFKDADILRDRLKSQGFVIHDNKTKTYARPVSALEVHPQTWREYSSSREVPSLLLNKSELDISIVIVACNYLEDVQRCIRSVLRWSSGHALEVVAVDNGSSDGTSQWLEDTASSEPLLRVLHTDHVLGDAAAKNIGLRQSLGNTIVMLDTCAEVTGDLYGPLIRALRDGQVGVVGPFGLRTSDLRHFEEVPVSCEVDAIQAYCFAFRRADLPLVGWMPESFRFYRNLDIQYSFQFKANGFRILANPKLPIHRHEHRVWSALADKEREKLSGENFRRFLKQWNHRTDLLVEPSSAQLP